MNIRKILFFGITMVFFLNSCNNSKQQQNSEKDEVQWKEEQETYAEISVKEGGQWEESKYVGGTFQNVQELQLPENHTDHSGYIRYEGPGWENSQVGYRLYLDWRNAIDIFGKKVDTMVLAQVGHPNSGSYHDEAPWGLDILKAGESLGLGGFGRFMNDSVAHFCEVKNTTVSIDNSTAASKVKIDYSGWSTGKDTIDLSAVFSIFPRDRFTKVLLSPSSDISGLCTGIVKFDDIPLIQNEDEKWGYIATYGNQTLVGDEDKLGMAIFFKKEQLQQITEGPNDHLVVLKPARNITYYFLGAWGQEKDGLTSKEEFTADLNAKLSKLEREGEL